MFFIFNRDQNVKFFIPRHVHFKVKKNMKTTHIERVNVLNIHQHDPKDKKQASNLMNTLKYSGAIFRWISEIIPRPNTITMKYSDRIFELM